MARKKIAGCAVKKLLQGRGIDFKRDWFEISPSDKNLVADAAKLAGFRKSKSSSGSTGRAFFTKLAKADCGPTSFTLSGMCRPRKRR